MGSGSRRFKGPAPRASPLHRGFGFEMDRVSGIKRESGKSASVSTVLRQAGVNGQAIDPAQEAGRSLANCQQSLVESGVAWLGARLFGEGRHPMLQVWRKNNEYQDGRLTGGDVPPNRKD